MGSRREVSSDRSIGARPKEKDPEEMGIEELRKTVLDLRQEREEVREHLSETVWLVAEYFGAVRGCWGCMKAIRKWDQRTEMGTVCFGHMRPPPELFDSAVDSHRAITYLQQSDGVRLSGNTKGWAVATDDGHLGMGPTILEAVSDLEKSMSPRVPKDG